MNWNRFWLESEKGKGEGGKGQKHDYDKRDPTTLPFEYQCTLGVEARVTSFSYFYKILKKKMFTRNVSFTIKEI